ncbi:hypothetical protein [Thiolapillus sp.]|uniref:hypothetical protein n=1 Tax=Thiolapillus sp. TaxID=2017437 RepID=UPI003AF76731
MKNTGLLLLGVWLLARGIQDIIQLCFRHDEILFASLGLAAGVMLLLDAMASRFASLGLLFLALWLLGSNALLLFNFNFPASGQLLSGLGIIAGMLLIFRK